MTVKISLSLMITAFVYNLLKYFQIEQYLIVLLAAVYVSLVVYFVIKITLNKQAILEFIILQGIFFFF